MDELVLDVQNLGHSFKKGKQRLEVFHDVSFQICSGQVVAIGGESGSGKTTMLLACGAMMQPEKGVVVLDGVNLFAAGSSERNKIRAAGIGYMFQTLELVPYLNVLQNLTLHDRSLKTEAIKWLEKFDLSDRIRHRPDELSHGQRQRVALIRALVHKPLLLIADEPTGNLDQKNSQIVFDILRQFANAGGAVLIASHDQSVESIADHVFLLADQCLTETDSAHKQTSIPTPSVSS